MTEQGMPKAMEHIKPYCDECLSKCAAYEGECPCIPLCPQCLNEQWAVWILSFQTIHDGFKQHNPEVFKALKKMAEGE